MKETGVNMKQLEPVAKFNMGLIKPSQRFKIEEKLTQRSFGVSLWIGCS